MKKNSIIKIWMASLELMVKKPIVILPFIIVAFFEGIALELIYFSTRFPISVAARPIIRKFFGEPFLHYPSNLIILGKLFYSAQIVIYIFISVAMMAIAINIFNNIKHGLPIKMGALVKNAGKRYFAYFTYGCAIVALLFLSDKVETFVFSKIMFKVGRFIPQYLLAMLPLCLMLVLFITSVIIYTLMISTVPLMVLGKKPLLKSCGLSIWIGARNFFKIFPLILLPFIVYLPFTLIKSFPKELADKTFPEANLLINVISVIVTVFVDCFMVLSVSQWLVENKKESGITD